MCPHVIHCTIRLSGFWQICSINVHHHSISRISWPHEICVSPSQLPSIFLDWDTTITDLFLFTLLTSSSSSLLPPSFFLSSSCVAYLQLFNVCPFRVACKSLNGPVKTDSPVAPVSLLRDWYSSRELSWRLKYTSTETHKERHGHGSSLIQECQCQLYCAQGKLIYESLATPSSWDLSAAVPPASHQVSCPEQLQAQVFCSVHSSRQRVWESQGTRDLQLPTIAYLPVMAHLGLFLASHHFFLSWTNI